MSSNLWVCDHVIAGIVGSNPDEVMDVRLLFYACGLGSNFCDRLITSSEGS